MHLLTPPIHTSTPAPSDAGERHRWQHTRMRRRLLDGTWRTELERRVADHVGSLKATAWGPLDLSSNAYRVIMRELAVLYDRPPIIRHDLEQDGGGRLAAWLGDDGPIARSGLWSQMPRYQTWVLGCREYLLRVGCSPDGHLRYRPVPPDHVVASAPTETPDVPDRVMELRHRDEWGWTWDLLDVSAPDAPVYEVLQDRGPHRDPVPITEQVLGAQLSGSAYPYRHADGRPVLPYVLHHAERLGDRLWDPYDMLETVEGSLNAALAYTFWFHVLRDASWPQRYTVNAQPAGSAASVGGDRLEVVTDPATLLILQAIEQDQGTPAVGQFEPGGDPLALEQAITAYTSRLAQDAGISSTDLQRMSGDPRSGYAISLSEQGKRAAQRRYATAFRTSDELLLSTSAAIYGSATGERLPETGYSVAYQEIPLSPDELSARREHVLALMEAGLMSRVEAYQHMHPGVSAEQARQDLETIAAERAARGGQT